MALARRDRDRGDVPSLDGARGTHRLERAAPGLGDLYGRRALDTGFSGRRLPQHPHAFKQYSKAYDSSVGIPRNGRRNGERPSSDMPGIPGGTGQMVVRKHLEHLSLPDGYSAKCVDAVWCLFDPYGKPLLSSADATAVEIDAWRDVWRRRHEDFVNECAMSRAGAGLPDI